MDPNPFMTAIHLVYIINIFFSQEHTTIHTTIHTTKAINESTTIDLTQNNRCLPTRRLNHPTRRPIRNDIVTVRGTRRGEGIAGSHALNRRRRRGTKESEVRILVLFLDELGGIGVLIVNRVGMVVFRGGGGVGIGRSDIGSGSGGGSGAAQTAQTEVIGFAPRFDLCR